ncbi:hypothetical protein GHT06_019926 [Daphnia sinensis]|uniref:Uncharacterized protein n=1 Tax=Daphnia sinensis TaxID=1820382 RepID=A0AAD5PR23_9CRUS|nr:hypothetical protein GHT06_019926 [Daphnia sinensis]
MCTITFCSPTVCKKKNSGKNLLIVLICTMEASCKQSCNKLSTVIWLIFAYWLSYATLTNISIS